ncbi:Prespore-specific transcriptional regulator RsfA [compost metagenome]
MERRDSWTDEDDIILANAVLKHIREDSTQLKGFEEASDKLCRTTSACGFRWNSMVRKKYEVELKEAKEIRKNGRVSFNGITTNEILTIPTTDINQVMDAFKTILDEYNHMKQLISNLQEENNNLKRQIENRPIDDISQSLMELMNRAREMGILNNKNKPAI